MLRFIACSAVAAWVAAASLCSAETLRWAGQADYLTADPHSANEAYTNALNGQVYDGLIMRNRRHELVPALAQSWERTTPRRWVFHLRRGVKFHDGSEFTADDVVFSFRRLAKSASFRALAAALGEPARIDRHTVEFVTPEPNPVMLEMLAESLFVMSRAWSEKSHAEMPGSRTERRETYATRHAMGTGAYRLESFSSDSASVFRKNPGWWGIAEGLFHGNVDEFQYRPIKSDATRVAALLSGELDLILDTPLQDVERLKRDSAIRIHETPENRVVYLSMDQARDELLYSNVKGRNPLKDRRVRQAIYQAIDIDAIHHVVMRGRSQPTAVLLPNAALAGIPRALDRRYPYDVVAAKRLLAAAGYPEGFGLTLDCPNNRLVNDEKICLAIAGMLAKVGIETNVNAMPRTIFFPKVRNRDTSFFLASWGGATDPLFTLPSLVHGANERGEGNNNLGGYRDSEIDRLIDAAKAEMDAGRRSELMAAALKIHHENAYDIPLHLQTIVWAARANVELVPRPDNWLQVSWITIGPASSRWRER